MKYNMAAFIKYIAAFMFLNASFSKILNPTEAVYSLMYLGANESLSIVVVWLLVVTEIFLAMSLTLYIHITTTIKTSICLLAVFCIYLACLYVMDAPVGCGCGMFPFFKEYKMQIQYGMARNVVAIIGLIYLWNYRMKVS